MTDQNTFDLFEQRVASELERFVASATDPRPATEIADEAMRPRGVRTRLAEGPRSRRMLFFALAAVLLIPAALVGAGALLRLAPDPIDLNQGPIATLAPSFVADATPEATPLVDQTRVVVVRRSTDGSNGVSVYAVRADGAERLLRQVPDSVLPEGHSFQIWGLVSASGWIALAEQEEPWSTILVDLADPQSEPWIVPDSTAGGGIISPAWGPQGYLAVLSGDGMEIVDPETRSVVRHIAGDGIGGGPSIIWAEDGSGIVDRLEDGRYGVQPIDGGSFEPGFPPVFNSRGEFGDEGAALRICSPNENCPGGDDGRILLTEVDGTNTTIWQQTGSAASAAMFGPTPGEYLIQTSGDAGRKIVVERVLGDNVDVAASIDRPVEWRYWSMLQPPSDASLTVFFVDLGNDFFATAIAPTDSTNTTLHLARFAGYLGSAITDAPGDGSYVSYRADPVETATTPYAMPPIGELIGAEMALNPCCGRVVIGQGSHDAVEGDSQIEEYQITVDSAGDSDVHLDCYGEHEVTVRSGRWSVHSPCTGPGGSVNVFPGMEAGDVVTVSASHDTTWRVALYVNVPQPGDTPAPVAEPVPN